MTDPYEILNVPSTATDEEVKKAYRDLARKYHPDNYHDNPLADLAQEKMKEINAAYDAIQKERSGRARSGGGYARSGGYQYQSQYQGGYQSQAREGAAVFQQVRMAINRNDLGLAEQLLRQTGEHGGEWNFLMGMICYRRGWIDEARRYYQTACQLDPGNVEYRQTLNFVENSAGGYRPAGYEVYSTCGKMASACLTFGLCSCACCGRGAPFFPFLCYC